MSIEGYPDVWADASRPSTSLQNAQTRIFELPPLSTEFQESYNFDHAFDCDFSSLFDPSPCNTHVYGLREIVLERSQSRATDSFKQDVVPQPESDDKDSHLTVMPGAVSVPVTTEHPSASTRRARSSLSTRLEHPFASSHPEVVASQSPTTQSPVTPQSDDTRPGEPIVLTVYTQPTSDSPPQSDYVWHLPPWQPPSVEQVELDLARLFDTDSSPVLPEEEFEFIDCTEAEAQAALNKVFSLWSGVPLEQITNAPPNSTPFTDAAAHGLYTFSMTATPQRKAVTPPTETPIASRSKRKLSSTTFEQDDKPRVLPPPGNMTSGPRHRVASPTETLASSSSHTLTDIPVASSSHHHFSETPVSRQGSSTTFEDDDEPQPSHRAKNRLHCLVGECTADFSTRLPRDVHMLVKHFGFRFTCPGCTKHYEPFRSLSKHITRSRHCLERTKALNLVNINSQTPSQEKFLPDRMPWLKDPSLIRSPPLGDPLYHELSKIRAAVGRGTWSAR